MTDKPRKPWLSGLFTVFSIGLGHIYTGQAKRGIILFFISQAILVFSMSLLLFPIIPLNIVVAILLGLILSYIVF